MTPAEAERKFRQAFDHTNQNVLNRVHQTGLDWNINGFNSQAYAAARAIMLTWREDRIAQHRARAAEQTFDFEERNKPCPLEELILNQTRRNRR